MIHILGIFPLYGNGGIASWTKKYLVTFPNEEYEIFPLPSGSKKDFTTYRNSFDRAYWGIKALVGLYFKVKKTLKQNPEISLMHITTSAGMGVVRDNVVAKLCHRKGVKCIMHCRFGTIKELYNSGSFWGKVFRANMKLYDNIWVLDRRSFDFLTSIKEISDKIRLTPNSIQVPDEVDLSPKTYKNIGFVGNILDTKGIFELVEAVIQSDQNVKLTIAGFGSQEILDKLKGLCGEFWGNKVEYVGKLPNEKAVALMKELDVIALPTYYPGEAFPISILEAMSRGKLVLSCPRAAIPDMLTANDGSMCGVLVAERSKDEIVQAIDWIVSHEEECDEMCKKAYEKVKAAYRMEVVYDLYRKNYKMLV